MKKWIVRILIGIVGLLVIAAGTIYAISEIRIAKVYDPVKITAFPMPAADDSLALEKGRHLATAVLKCTECHGDHFGGKTMLNEPSTIGVLAGSNLTTGNGGIGTSYKPEDWIRSIRYGIAPDGHGLMIMPSNGFYHLSDADLGAIVAYIKSMPPVDSDSIPTKSLGPLGRALLVFGMLPLFPADEIDPTVERRATPPPGITVEYGKHLAEMSGCPECHGPQLSGGKIPGAPPDFPPSTNITPDKATGIGNWSEADFYNALRTGKRPDGTAINPIMPWKYIGQMTDDELRAIWMFIQTFPPRPEGTR
jgi:cytochrome c553